MRTTLVIEISDKLYNFVRSRTSAGNRRNFDGYDMYDVSRCIENGKPFDKMLDEMKAEIKELEGKYVIGDYAVFGESSPKHVPLWEVLQIIDKYKEGDSE